MTNVYAHTQMGYESGSKANGGEGMIRTEHFMKVTAK